MSLTTEDQLPLPYETPRAISTGKWLVLAAAFLGWMFDGLEMGIFPQIARPALHNLLGTASENTIKGWQQVIDASFLFGAAFGGLVFGWLGDRIGRVRALSFSIIVYSVFTGLLYFVTAPIQIVPLRFIAAIGMGGEWSLGVALVMEVWDAKRRPLLAGLIGAAANVGFVIIGLIGSLVHVNDSNWRLFPLIGVAPALLTFVIRLFVPESHKWQTTNRESPIRPIAELTRDPVLLKSALLAIVFASIALLGTWGAVQKIPAWVSSPNMPGRTPSASGNVQMALGLGAILGCMVAPFLASIFNRRVAYFVLCLGSLVGCELLFRTFHAYSNGFLGMTFFVGAITAAVYGWLPLYLPELFPTRVRATGQGIAFNFGRILAGGGALWGGLIGNSYAEMGAYVSLIYVVGLIVIWFAPETKGRPLPD